MTRPTSDTVDATRPLTISVTPDDIARAVPGDDSACALAQAMIRRRGVAGVSIGATTALVRRTNGTTERYSLSKNDQAIIRAFDDSTIFPTVSVTLLPPASPLGSRAGTKPGTNKRSGKKNTVKKHLERQASRHVHTP